MEYVYAAMLLHSTKQPINEENIKKILKSVGVTAEETKLKAIVASLEGQNIDELIKQAAVAVAAPVKEEKKEKKEEEAKPEEAAAGLSMLFSA